MNRIELANVNKLTVVLVGNVEIPTKSEIPVRKPVPQDNVGHPSAFSTTIKYSALN